MDEHELLRFSQSVGLDPATALQWRKGFRKGTSATSNGPPKGKIPRPRGWITVADAKARFGVDAGTLRAWRAGGLAFRVVRTMILMSRSELSARAGKMRRDAK